MMYEKEFNKRIKALPVRKQLGYNELAYARTDSERVYSFCPLCKKIVVVNKGQVETETKDQIKLKGTVSCDCRSWIRYLNKDFLKKTQEKEVSVWPSLIGCAAVFAAANIALYAVLGLPEDYNRQWDLPVALFLLALMIAALIGGVASFFHPVELLFRRDPGRDPKHYFKSTIDEIYPMIYQYQMEKKEKREEKQKKTEGSNDQQPVPKTNKNENRKGIGNVMAGAAGYYAASACLADSEADYESHDFNAPDSYVPDDFEPDLDPYDRQALYDEEVIDDFVIAGGGNPFDFEDRMDALSDPFGFGGDGDTWD